MQASLSVFPGDGAPSVEIVNAHSAQERVVLRWPSLTIALPTAQVEQIVNTWAALRRPS